MADNTIKIGIKYEVDKVSLENIKKQLKEITNTQAKDYSLKKGLGLEEARVELNQIRTSIGQLQGALNKSYNADLGTLNVSKFNKALKDLPLQEIYTNMSKFGAEGKNAFRNIMTEALTTNTKLKQTSGIISNLSNEIKKLVKYNVASSVINTVTGQINQAYGYVKNLDRSLADIRIVTKQSKEDMAEFAREANRAAQDLKTGTVDYTDAALIWAQSGMRNEDIAKMGETTMKVANVTRQSGEAAASQIMAIMNGFKISVDDAEESISKIAGVAANSASNLQELSASMGRVASMANQMGVSQEQLSAMLGTTISVTRQSAETVGTAYKSILNRMSDIKAGEGEISLGTYTTKMKELGVNVLDSSNKLREMGNVIEEVGSKWNTYSKEEQRALASAMGGTYQSNMITALFENFDEYERLMGIATTSTGELQAQQEEYADSTGAKLKQLTAAWENLFDSLLSGDTIGEVADVFTTLVNGVTNFIDGIGGGGNILLAFGSIATRVFSKDISSAVLKFIENFSILKEKIREAQEEFEVLNSLKEIGAKEDPNNQKIVDLIKERISLDSVLSEKEKEYYNDLVKQRVELENQKEIIREKIDQTNELVGILGSQMDQESFFSGNFLDSDKLDEMLNALNQLEESTDTNDEVLNNYYKTLKKLGTGTTTINKLNNSFKKIKNNTKNFNILNEAIKETVEQANNLANGLGEDLIPPDILKELKNLVNELNNIDIQNIADGDEATISSVQNLIDKFTSANDIIKNKIKESWNLFSVDTQNILNSIGLGIDQIDDAVNEFTGFKKLQKGIQEVIIGVASFGELVSGVTSITNAFELLGDESLSTGEKITQFISGVLFGLPMIIQGLTGVVKLFSLVGTAINATTLAEGIRTGVTIAQTVADGVHNVVLAIKAKLMALINSQALIGAAVFAALAAVIWAVVSAIKALVDWYYRDENAAKKAEEEAKALTEEYNKAKEASENLKKSLGDYDAGVSALNALKQGTAEWSEQLEEVNGQVLDLMNKYPELANYISQNKNGLLEISNEGKEKLIEQFQNRASTLKVASLNAQNYANELRNKADTTALAREIGTVSDPYSNQKGISALAMNSALQKVADAVNKYGIGILGNTSELKKVANLNDAQVSVLKENMSSVKDLMVSVQANTKAIEIRNKQIGAEMLEKVGFDKESEDFGVMSKIAGAKFDQAVDKLYEEDYKDKGKWGGGKTDEEIQKAYADLMNYDWVSNEWGNEGKYRNKETGEEFKLDDAVARRALAAKEAEKNSEEIFKTLEKDLNNFVDGVGVIGDKSKKAVKNVLEGQKELGNLTKDELENFKNTLNTDFITDEMAKNLGYDNAQLLKDALAVAIENSETQFKDMTKTMNTRVLESFQDITSKMGDLSLEETERIKNILETADSMGILNTAIEKIETSGIAAAEVLVGFINELDSFAGIRKNLRDIAESYDINDEIKPEDYEKLISTIESLGGDVSDEYLKMLESLIKVNSFGQKQIIGDIKSFVKELQDISLEKEAESFKALKEGTRKNFWEDYDTIDKSDRLNRYGKMTKSFSEEHQQKIGERIGLLGEYGTSDFFNKNIGPINKLLENAGIKIEDFKNNYGLALQELSENWEQYSSKLNSNTIENILPVLEELNSSQDTQGKKLKELTKVWNDYYATAGSEENAAKIKEIAEKYGIKISESSLNKGRDLISKQDLKTDEIEKYKKIITDLNKDLKMTDELTDELAVAMLRSSKGIEDLSKNWDDWKGLLSSTNKEIKDTKEYLDALYGTKTALSDLFDLSPEAFDLIDKSFIQDNFNLINQAAAGSESAIDALQQKILELSMKNLQTELEQLGQSDVFSQIEAEVENMKKWLEQDIKAGSIQDTNLKNSLAKIINLVGGDVSKIQAILDSLGLEIDAESLVAESSIQMPEGFLKADTSGLNQIVNDVANAAASIFSAFAGGSPLLGSVVKTAQNLLKLTPAFDTIPAANMLFPFFGFKTKNVSGSAIKYNQKTIGSKAARGSSAKKTGGGSGGGGGGSSKKPQIKEKTNIVKDIYHDINRQLELSNRKLDNISKNQDKAWGIGKLKLYNEELKETNKNIDLLKEKQKISNQDLTSQRQKMIDFGFKFDTNGELTNYFEMFDKVTKRYNDFIDQFNKLSAEQQESDEWQKKLEAEEEHLKKFEELLKELDEKEALNHEIKVSLSEQSIKAMEARIKAFNFKVEFTADFTSFKRSLENYTKTFGKPWYRDENMVDQATWAHERANVPLYETKEVEARKQNLEKRLKIWRAWKEYEQKGTPLDEIPEQYKDYFYTDTNGKTHINQDKWMEDWKNEVQDAAELAMDIKDIEREAYGYFLKSIDQWFEAFDKQRDLYDKMNSQIAHNIDIINMVYGDTAFNERDTWYSQRQSNYKKILESQKAEMNAITEQLNKETDREAREKLQERWNELAEQLKATTVEAMNAAKEQMDNLIDGAINKWQRGMTKGMTFDSIGEQWELEKKALDKYLDDVNSVYEVGALKNKYLDAIDNTDNIKQQQELRDLMEEQIGFLQEKEFLTRYDVERAEKLLDIEIKKQALEEAKNNKSNMRLRRDSQGNYTYQFVADEAEVEKAEQELAKAQNDLYNFDKNAYHDNLSEAINLAQEYKEKLAEIYKDTTMDAEEKERMIAFYNQYYQEEIRKTGVQNNVILKNLNSSMFDSFKINYDLDNENFKAMTGHNIEYFQNMSDEQKRIMFDEIIPEHLNGIQQMVDAWTGPDGFEEQTKKALSEMEKANKEYSKELEKIASKAKIDLENIADGHDDINTALEKQIKNTEKIATEGIQYIEQTRKKWQQVYETLQKVNGQLQDYITSGKNEIGKESYSQSTSLTSKPAGYNLKSSIVNADEDNRMTYRGYKNLYTAAKVAEGKSYDPKTDGGATKDARDMSTSDIFYQARAVQTINGNSFIGLSTNPDDPDSDFYWYRVEWLNKIAKMKTGGYTGEWSNGSVEDNGRLAFLHQKELVLNENDTKNLLETVDIINQLYNKIKRSKSGIEAILSNSIAETVAKQINNAQYQQEVRQAQQMYEQLKPISNIEPISTSENNIFNVSFPNATNHNEIEQAIENLRNRASQRNGNQIR